jgi:hypothetical protein
MPFDNPPRTPFGDIELLREARSRISNRDHWVQGRFQDGDRHCLIAVLSLVSGSPSFDAANRVEQRLTRLLGKELPSRFRFWARVRFLTAGERLMRFNDDAHTSHEDVIALFDRTINLLEGQAPASCSAIAQRSPAMGVHP